MYVITGGGSGIGRALAHALAVREKKVLIVGRRKDRLHETASFSPNISICCAAIETKQGRDTLSAHLADISQLSGLVHNAGTVEPIKPLAMMSEVEWQTTQNINLGAPLFLTQQLLHKLQEGRVLNIGSGAAYFPVVGWAAYCVSKAALAMLTQCWQLESTSTAFASVMPGIVDTDMQALIRHSTQMDPKQVDFYKTLKQEDRLVTPTTVGTFLAWLLLDVKKTDYTAQEWDIYETCHHHHWLTSPNRVPHWEK